MAQPSTALPIVPNNSAEQCFSHQHMTSTEYAVWSVCRAMASAHNGVVFFSGPKIARKFRSMSKNTPYGAASSLLKTGWFKKVKDSYHTANGQMSSTHYRVLTHAEWANDHPNSCPNPSHDEGMEPSQNQGTEHLPSQNQGTTVPESGKVHPKIGESPSQPEGKNLYKPLIQTTDLETNIPASPSQFEGTAFISRFGKGGKKKSRETAKADAGMTLAQPSQNQGMVPSNPDLLAKTTSAVLDALGLNKFYTSSWSPVVQRLLSREPEPCMIPAVAKFFVERYGNDTVYRERERGFENAYDRLHKELTSVQLEEMMQAKEHATK